MGRRKISIKQIADPKLRHITFNKRKNGLIKKAAELSLLCNVNMLLIFEDGNGNLIQFSKNKLTNIAGFFQECRYNSVIEFAAKDYPNFFKVNHYKKQKDRDQDDFGQDDKDDGSDTLSNQPSFTQSATQAKQVKKEKVEGVSRTKGDDRNKLVYQSGSEDSSNDGNDEISHFSGPQPKQSLNNMQNNQIKLVKPKIVRNDDKLKSGIHEDESNLPASNEQEGYPNQKEAFQNYKEINQRMRPEKQVEFPSPYMGFEHPFKRSNPMADPGNPSFRFYPTDGAPLNGPTPSNGGYVSNPAYANTHPYMHNSHGYQPVPNNFPNAKANRMRGFGPMNMGNEEALNAMLKGFSPLGFAIGGNNPFMNKPSGKPEMDEKLIDTANMIKYLNGAAGTNPYTGQKMYAFHPNEVAKPEDMDPMANLRNRNDHEGMSYELEHDFHEMPPYVRGDFRMEANLQPSLPSAYFSSKKFNFEGYPNNTFEDERFNEFGDSKKKLKP